MIKVAWLFEIQSLKVIYFASTIAEIRSYLLSWCKSHSVAAW